MSFLAFKCRLLRSISIFSIKEHFYVNFPQLMQQIRLAVWSARAGGRHQSHSSGYRQRLVLGMAERDDFQKSFFGLIHGNCVSQRSQARGAQRHVGEERYPMLFCPGHTLCQCRGFVCRFHRLSPVHAYSTNLENLRHLSRTKQWGQMFLLLLV